jgi:molecular chaperone GrpE (heat shock protein)/type II secretory pathway pseudopilin PulG
MLKRLVVLGLVLLIAGAAVLGWVLAERRRQQEQTALYRSKYDSELSDDLKRYNEWLQLPPEERPALPPSLDGYEKTGVTTQQQQEQQERLKADLEKLAADDAEPPPLADFLYGENWQEQLDEYKKRTEQNEFIFTASIVCTSIGGTIFASCLLQYIVRLIIGTMCRLRKLSACLVASRQVSEDEDPVRLEAAQDQENSQASSTLWACFADESQGQKQCTQQTGLRTRAKAVASSTSQNSNNGHKGRAKLAASQRGSSLSVQRATPEHSDVLNGTLTELTEQVAAIREYASDQQDRVRKLEEGYDWNIIRNFCLRVIRCIDNLESRISQQSAKCTEASHLKEVRDELVFALESSGVERFEPEIDSDYRGQEKYAEAVKDREHCDDPDKTGKIAQIIRPGYRYSIDEENVKIVRPAAVKLFG